MTVEEGEGKFKPGDLVKSFYWLTSRYTNDRLFEGPSTVVCASLAATGWIYDLMNSSTGELEEGVPESLIRPWPWEYRTPMDIPPRP